MIIELIFWCLAIVVVYVYAGYPALLCMLPVKKVSGYDLASESLPTVTLLISAYNEVNCIGAKLENSLALQYPAEKLKIVVISDASDDGTDDIVAAVADSRVSLLRMERRGGKTLGLNAGVANADSDIIVFSDANAMYVANAIRALVAPFADETVGAVVGESTYGSPKSDSGRSESLYWKYETFVKMLETRNGSVVGGDGAIYGIRREHYVPLAAGDLSDFVNPLQVVHAGHRCVYEPAAMSYEEAAVSFAGEFGRKVRIVNRAWRALWKMRAMLNPFKLGVFSLKLWSHKVLRWLIPLFLIALFVANTFLAAGDPFYLGTLIAQGTFYALALIGYNWRHRRYQPAITRIPYYFCLVNVAAAAALLEVFRGVSHATWTTVRG